MMRRGQDRRYQKAREERRDAPRSPRDTGVSSPRSGSTCASRTSRRPPEIGGAPGSPCSEPFEALIDSWLLEDRRCWRKAPYAKRVYDRLVAEGGVRGLLLDGPKVREAAGARARRRARRPRGLGFLLLDWLPGECQVDFGPGGLPKCEAWSPGAISSWSRSPLQRRVRPGFLGRDRGVRLPGAQERVEFVRRRAAARRLRQRHRGRPQGRRAISTSALFRRFAAHYGLDYSFTSPYSGNEKGSVENKVGALRRNLFVPMPQIWDVKAYNGRLLDACLALSEGQAALPQGRARSELFGDDRAALSPSPQRHSRASGGSRGSATAGLLQGRRRAPLLGGPGQRLARGRRRDGRLRRHGRRPRRRGGGGVRPRMGRGADGLGRPRAQLRLLAVRPGGWRDSVVRRSLPDELVAFLDSEAPGPGGRPQSAAGRQRPERDEPAAVEGALRSLRRRAAWTPRRSSSPPRGRPRATRSWSTTSRSTCRADRAFGLLEGVRPVPGMRSRSAGSSPRAPGRCSYQRRRYRGSSRPRPRASSPRAQGMLARELESQERSKQARLLRQARVPGAQGGRGLRLVERALPRRLGPRRHTLARLRRPRGGPRLPRPHRPREDARGDSPLASRRPGAGCPCASSRRPRWCSSSGRQSATDGSTG